MKYYKNDQTGQVYAFADDGSQDAYIPSNLRLMTAEEVQQHLNPPITKAKRLEQLNTDFTAAMTTLQGTWPTMEIQTWTLQAEEAKQWTAADTADKPLTPFLTSLYEKRVALGWSEPFADFVARVLVNSVTYTTASANYLAIRHVAERAINAATDPSTVTWSF